MRKRHTARPRLEPMEDRLVLSIAGLFDPTAGIRSAIASLSHAHPARATHHGTAHSARSQAATHPSKAAHAGHHHHPKSSTSSNSFSSFFQNFLKSTGL